MANEAVLIYETQQPIQMTVSNSVGIEKGALLTLSDPMTAALCTTSGAATAGIAKSEKIASDGVTSLAVFDEGYFKLTLSGSGTVGDYFQFCGNNQIISANSTVDTYYAGILKETGTDGETVLCKLQPGKLVN